MQRSNLVYRGAFRMPSVQAPDVETFAYTGCGFAFNPANRTLFAAGHIYEHRVAEVSIPAPVIAPSVSGLPRAQFVQPLTNIAGAFLGQLGDAQIDNSKNLGGLLIYGGELWANVYAYYDGAGQQRYSLHKGPTTLSGARTGVYGATGNVPSIHWMNRYLGHIPAEWQPAFGGKVFAGAGTGFSSIASFQSNGPSFAVFDPASLTGTAHKSTVAARLALGYPVSSPLRSPSQQSDVWNFTSGPAGAVFVGRSILYFGCHGIGAYSYPPAAPPYRAYVWAYDANDLLEVLSGSRSASSVQPYGVWDISDMVTVGGWSNLSIKGVAADGNRIYVYCGYQDVVVPLVQVFDVS